MKILSEAVISKCEECHHKHNGHVGPFPTAFCELLHTAVSKDVICKDCPLTTCEVIGINQMWLYNDSPDCEQIVINGKTKMKDIDHIIIVKKQEVSR